MKFKIKKIFIIFKHLLRHPVRSLRALIPHRRLRLEVAFLAILLAIFLTISVPNVGSVKNFFNHSGNQTSGQSEETQNQPKPFDADQVPKLEADKSGVFKNPKLEWAPNENPEFQIDLSKVGSAAPKPTSFLNKLLGAGSANAAPKRILKADVLDYTTGKTDDSKVSVEEKEDTADVQIKSPGNAFKPGRFQLQLEILSADGKDTTTTSQDFAWGVLALNTNKAAYAPGETTYLQMGVVNDFGHTLCDAPLKLEITIPGGQKETLDTADGSIQKSDECGQDNVTDKPDYFANYKPAEVGDYQMKLTELDTGYSMNSTFSVAAQRDFDVERVSASRINPFKASYVMTLKVKANQDFDGAVKEKVPAGFEISEISGGGQTGDKNENDQTISWPEKMKSGDTVELSYRYQAPLVSPQFYLLGPLEIWDGNSMIFNESREWQIAADTGYVASKSSTWTDTTAWTTVGYPGQAATADTAQIGANWQMDDTVTPANSFASITFLNTCSTGCSVTVESGITMTLTGAVSVNSTAGADNIATIAGTGTMNVGSIAIGGPSTPTPSATKTTKLISTITSLSSSGATTLTTYRGGSNPNYYYNNATLDLQSGKLSATNITTSNPNSTCTSTVLMTTTPASATLNLTTTTPWTISGTGTSTTTLNGSAATVEYSAAGAVPVRVTAYTNLTLDGASGTYTGIVTSVSGALTMSNAVVWTADAITTGPASVTLNNTASLTLGASMTITGALAINNTATFSTSSSARTLSVGTTTSVTGTLTLANTSAKTFTGNVTLYAGAVWNETAVAAIGFGSSLANNATTFTASATGVHTFTGTTQSISGGTTTAIPSLSISVSVTNTGTLTVATTLAGAGTLTNGAGGTLNIGAASASVTLAGLTASAATNTVNYNGTAGQTVKDTTDHHYSNLTLTKTAGQVAILAAGTTVDANLTITSGTLQLSTYSFTVSGTTSITGVLDDNNSTGTDIFGGKITINTNGSWTSTGNSAYEIRGGISNGQTFSGGNGTYTFTTNTQNINGDHAYTFGGNIAISGAITVNNINTSTVTITGNIDGDNASSTWVNGTNSSVLFGGTVFATTGVLTATASGNAVSYNKGGDQTVKGVNYYNLTLATSGTKTMGTGTTAMGGNFSLTGTAVATTADNLAITGALSVGAGTTLTIGAFTFSVGTTTTVAATGSLIFSSATNPGKTFTGDVTVSGTWNEQAAITPSFGGNFTNNATSFTASSGTHTFTGTSKIIGGSTTNTIASISISGSLENDGTLTVSTALAGAGTFADGNGSPGTLNFAGSTIDVTNFSATSTNCVVNYNNTSAGQTVRAATYYNLTIAKTAQTATLGSGTTTVNGDLTVTSGILGGTDNLTVKGEVTGAGTITLTGSSTFTQQIGSAKSFGSSSGSNNWTFNNLNFENSSGGDLTVTSRSGGSGQIIISGTLTLGNAGNSNRTTFSNSSNNRILDVVNVSITSKGGLTTSGSASFTVSGTWTNNASGVLTAASGAVTFDGGAAQTVTAGGTDGNHDFYNITITNSSGSSNGVTFADSLTLATGGTFTDMTASSRLVFATGSTYTFPNISLAGGGVGTEVTLDSSRGGSHGSGSSGPRWTLTVGGTPSATYVKVYDSNATNTITATTGGVDGGDNLGWTFPATGITISGISNASSGTVDIAVNGSLQSGKTGSISGGTWSISTVTQPSTNNIITVWIDSAIGTNRSVGIAKYSGSGDETSMALNTNQVSLGGVGTQSIAMTDLGQYDYDNDNAIMYRYNSSIMDVGYNNMGNSEELDILSNTTLTMSGQTVNADHLVVDGTLTSTGSDTINLSGSGTGTSRPFIVNGTFNQGSSTVKYTGTSDSDIQAETYDNLNLSPSGAGNPTYNLGAKTGGVSTIDSYSETYSDNGDAALGGGVLNQGVGQSFAGNGAAVTQVKFYAEKINNPTGSAYAKIYAMSGTWGSGDNIPTGGALATSDAFDVSTMDTSLGLITFNFSTPFTTVNGTKYVVTMEYSGGDASNYLVLGSDSSSPTHSGNADGFSTGTWYAYGGYDLAFYVSSSVGSWDTTTVSGNLTVGDGTNAVTASYDSGDSALNVGGDMTIANSGTYVAAPTANLTLVGNFAINSTGTYNKNSTSGTFTFDGSSTHTWTDSNPTSSDMGGVAINGTSETVNLGSTMKATSVNVASGQTLGLGSSGYTLTITGSGTGASRPFIVGGTLNEGTNSTVKYTGTSDTTVQQETYYNLNLSPSGAGSPTYTLGTAYASIYTQDLTMGDGTNPVSVRADTYGPTIYVGGNLTIGAGSTYTPSESSFFFSGTTTPVTWADNNSTKSSIGSVSIGDGTHTKVVQLGSDVKATNFTVSTDATFTHNGAHNLNLSGYLAVNNPATYTNSSGGILTFEGSTGVNLTDYNSTKNNLGSVVIGDGTNTKTVTLGSDIKTIGLSILSNATLDNGAANKYSLNVGGNWSNSGTFTNNSGGAVTFDSASTGKTIDTGGTSAGKTFYNVTFNNGSGGWLVQNYDMKASHNLTFTDLANWTLASGRTLEVDGTYSAADSVPAKQIWNGSTFYLNSGTNYTVGSKTQTAARYSTLQIGASTDIRMWNSSALTYTVDSSGSLYSMNHNSAPGTLYIWGDYHALTNDYWSYNTDFDGTDISSSPRAVNVWITSGADIEVDSGKRIDGIGGGQGFYTIVDRQGSSGGYGISVNSGGTINFNYTDFEHLEAPTGINILSGGTVAAGGLNYCRFNNIDGSNGSYITVDAGAIGTGTPSNTFTSVEFYNTSGSPLYNVNRTGTGSSNYWLFTGYTGPFSGAGYEHENDGNNMIQWASALDTPGGQETIQGSVNFQGSATFQ